MDRCVTVPSHATSCSAITMDAPFVIRSQSMPVSPCLPAASSAADGSSNMMSSLEVQTVAARNTYRKFPVERLLHGRSSDPSNDNRSSVSGTSFDERPSKCCQAAIHRRGDMGGGSTFAGKYAVRFGPVRVPSRSDKTLASTRNKVDFPLPFTPTTPRASPAWIEKSTPLRT